MTNKSIHKMHEIIYKICNKSKLLKENTKIQRNKNRDYVYLYDPLILSRIVGHLKHGINHNKSGKRYQIFMRGQIADYPGMVPTIYRDLQNSSTKLQNRIKAYKELIGKLPKTLDKTRFRGDVGGATLQHYGIKTPWIDIVDNLFVAIWFAINKITNKEPFEYNRRNKKDYGWIYFIQVEDGQPDDHGIISGKETKWCDLRSSQTPLSLRPHTQHGLSVCRINWDTNNYDDYVLDKFVLATVKFPINNKFVSLINDIIPSSLNYMFPSSTYDNTYKVLRNEKVTDIIKSVTIKCNLSTDDLGKIYLYADS